jgi:glucan endo-1,3-alpha-glucosidase
MSHEAFREMVRYFADIWRSGGKEVLPDEVKIWGWYRTHPARAAAETDDVGRPDHSDWVSRRRR